MTFAASEASSNKQSAVGGQQLAGLRSRAGFTLIELMTVMLIISVLAALILGAIFRSRKTALRTRLAADLQTISIALDAYKFDMGDYPRLDYAHLPGPVPPGPIGTAPNVYGSQLLCWALIAPAGTVPVGALAASTDGADGPGFRVRPGNPPQGKIYGPYLAADRFKIDSPSSGNLNEASILDSNGHPILYFAATPGRANPAVAYIGQNDYSNPSSPVIFMYDANYGVGAFQRTGEGSTGPALARMSAMLGDLNNNGKIDNGETAATTLPYLLWAAGPDEFYGPNSQTPAAADVAKCDDVTNFNMGTQ